MKDNNKTSHWFSHSKLKSLDLEEVSKRRRIINELEDSLSGTTIEQSDSGMKNNPDTSIVVEVENYDADLTSYASKTNEEYDDINIS